ncbi:Piso0_002595 [Millerozyma farinosa CBS 7064]|uniref:Piso0_002595 protein n=1 Tax=Pichia sorbitophila (strain ATCC MYA-4447 / BCRC 22081 / CBS 7064 / NBRC 10061 / NRRL Y-12695) TaxID=559304 RepID=G8YD13_PICSO|nr:Piso0_002595 [Millerozyma farinosa CBS 7064]
MANGRGASGSPMANEGDEKPLEFSFSALTKDVTHLAHIFSSLTAINTQAVLMLTQEGMSVYTEHQGICNAKATIEPSLFSEFNFLLGSSSFPGQEHSEVQLSVDLGLISDSFMSVASNLPSKQKNKKGDKSGHTASDEEVLCYIYYEGEGHPLIVEFEDSLMSEKIEFPTFYIDNVHENDDDDADKTHELTINYNEILFEIILRSDVFANVIRDLQQINTIDLYMLISNEVDSRKNGTADNRFNSVFGLSRNNLNFISKGSFGNSKLICPNERAILEKLTIYERGEDSSTIQQVNTSIISRFAFSNFARIRKAVSLSSKCKIMKDISGIFSVQLLCDDSKIPEYSGTLIMLNMLENADLDYMNTSMSPDDDASLKYILYDDTLIYKNKNTPVPGPIDINSEKAGTGVSTERTKVAHESEAHSHSEHEEKKRRRIDDKSSKKKGQNIIEVPLFI